MKEEERQRDGPHTRQALYTHLSRRAPGTPGPRCTGNGVEPRRSRRGHDREGADAGIGKRAPGLRTGVEDRQKRNTFSVQGSHGPSATEVGDTRNPGQTEPPNLLSNVAEYPDLSQVLTSFRRKARQSSQMVFKKQKTIPEKHLPVTKGDDRAGMHLSGHVQDLRETIFTTSL